MKLKYTILTLLALVSALCFVPAYAQTVHKAKKQVKKGAHKPATKVHKPVAKARYKTAVQPAAVQKSTAKGLGEEVSKVKIDTTKKHNLPGNSLSEEIIVTTAYKPVLADAVKIRINPDLEDKTPFKAPLTYFPLDRRLELNTNIKPFDAMKQPKERDSDLYNNYVKAGLGNMNTTFGEAYFNTGRDPGLQFGGYLKHFMQSGSIKDQNSSREEASIFAKSIGAVNSLDGNITYNYRTNYFYGYDQSAPPPANLQRDAQHFSTLSAQGELTKNYQDVENDFTYALKLSGYSFSNAFQAKESNVVLSGFLNETVHQFYAGVSASVDVATQQDSAYNIDNSLIRANPYIKFQGDSYKIDAGINIVDQFGYASAFYIFPAAKAELQIVPSYLRIFVEAKGDVNRSSLLDFSYINPFLGQNIPIKNSVDRLDIAAGLKGTIAPGLGFKATIYRNEISDMPLFVSNFNIPAGYNRFTVIYDPGKSRVSGLNAELDYKASDDFDLFGRAEFKQYQMATVPQAWNMPKFKLTAGTTIHVSNLVNVTGTVFVRGSALDPGVLPPSGVQQGPTATPPPVTVGSFVDVSGEVEYKATKQLSIFVHVNNLLNGTNTTWLYYPDYGFNIFGGVGFKF
ncbi:MAG TPA: hypothetical protein VFE53_08960 [Mucilaginibacter sp.]|jgi:hypothetical protein|nr:hypothetical protein [Mucilaginibacter sp.]